MFRKRVCYEGRTLTSNLASNWNIIDNFEGEEYERVPVEVIIEQGDQVLSSIYRLKSLT